MQKQCYIWGSSHLRESPFGYSHKSYVQCKMERVKKNKIHRLALWQRFAEDYLESTHEILAYPMTLRRISHYTDSKINHNTSACLSPWSSQVIDYPSSVHKCIQELSFIPQSHEVHWPKTRCPVLTGPAVHRHSLQSIVWPHIICVCLPLMYQAFFQYTHIFLRQDCHNEKFLHRTCHLPTHEGTLVHNS